MKYQLWRTGELGEVDLAMLRVVIRHWRAGELLERDAAEFELVQEGYPYREVQQVIDRLRRYALFSIFSQPSSSTSEGAKLSLSPTLAGVIELGDLDCEAELDRLQPIVAALRSLYHPSRKLISPAQVAEQSGISIQEVHRLGSLTGAYGPDGFSLQNFVLEWGSFEDFLNSQLSPEAKPVPRHQETYQLEDLQIDFLPSALRWTNLGPYREATLELSPLTILVGANAAGKTSALRAIALTGAIAREGLEALQPELPRWRPSSKGPPGLIRQHTNELAITLEGELHNQGQAWKSVHWNADLLVNPRIAALRENLRNDPSEASVKLELGIGHWPGANGQPEPLHLRPNQLALCEATDTKRHAELIAIRQSAMGWRVALEPASPEVLRTLEFSLESLEEVAAAVLGPIKLRFGYPDLSIQQRNGYSVLLEHAPRGIYQVLTILMYVLRPNPPTLLAIDEIENHLHADVLERLIEVLRSFTHRTRILLTTHSSNVLRLVDPSEVRLVRAGDEGSSIVRVDQDPILSGLVKEGAMGQLLEEGYFAGKL